MEYYPAIKNNGNEEMHTKSGEFFFFFKVENSYIVVLKKKVGNKMR